MKVVALAGGVGGAKMVYGLVKILPPEDFTIVVNTGDDFDHFGLRISPDLDTVCYALAGIENPVTGWGRLNESWMAMESVEMLNGPTWFRLGDRDLGTHLERTRRFQIGHSLSQITRDFCAAWGIDAQVLPMSDDPIPTIVLTDEGPLPFQNYFVYRKCQPEVNGFEFTGADKARPAPGVLPAIRNSDLVVICPSNPWVSIDPILAVPGIRKVLIEKKKQENQKTYKQHVVAVSPIIGGVTVKGPAGKMFSEMGITPSALAVANHYRDFLGGFVFDRVDTEYEHAIQSMGITTLLTDTLMKNQEDRIRFAQEIIAFGKQLIFKQ